MRDGLGGVQTVLVLGGGSEIGGAIADRLVAGGLAADTPVAAVRWGTRPDQRTIRTTLAGLAAADVESPSVIVIGDVAALDLAWFERRPLFGREVVVTRSRDQASALARRLEALGATTVEVPTIELEPADDPASLVAPIAGADWLVFTSPNAVDAVTGQLHDARAVDVLTRVAAVGPGTAAALERFGIVADLVPARNVAEGLVESFPSGSGRVYLPQAADARPVLADGLRAKGWRVDTAVAYRTVPAPLTDDDRARAAAADAITFTSSSTVTNFLDAAGPDGVPPVVVTIGPVTTATAVERGLTVDAEADPHTIDGLVAAVVAALGGTPGT